MSTMDQWPRYTQWWNPNYLKETPLLDLDMDDADHQFIQKLKQSRYLAEEQEED